MKTPEEIAQDTLDDLAIKPQWKRSGEQILKIIQHAIKADRAQRSDMELNEGVIDPETEKALEDLVPGPSEIINR